MLARNPSIWAGGIAMSPFNKIDFAFKQDLVRPALYLEAGLYEDPGFQTARAMLPNAQSQKMRVTYNERSAGHDFMVWTEELPTVLTWLLKP